MRQSARSRPPGHGRFLGLVQSERALEAFDSSLTNPNCLCFLQFTTVQCPLDRCPSVMRRARGSSVFLSD